MTEKTDYSRPIQKIIDASKTKDEAQTRLTDFFKHPLSRGQIAWLADYYRAREVKQPAPKEKRITEYLMAKTRYLSMHPSHTVTKRGTRIVIRNTLGRFSRIPRYFKRSKS